jgi:SAM-dependent methyltransferase
MVPFGLMLDPKGTIAVGVAMTASELTVAPGNEAQARAWDGDEGELWARHHEFFETSTRLQQERLLEAAAIAAGERVLDVGCGSGGVTLAAARAADGGEAVGIDLSAPMIDVARESARAQGVGNATFVRGDAQVYPFEAGAYDVVLSCTGSMFFSDQVAAFRNLARALRPGGRVVLLSWRAPGRNEWFSTFVDVMTLGRPPAPPPPEAPSPFAHADPARTEQILTAAGLAEVRSQSVEEPMYFGRTVDEGFDVLSRLLGWMAGDLTPGERSVAFGKLRSSLEEHLTAEGVAYGSAAWLVTAQRP